MPPAPLGRATQLIGAWQSAFDTYAVAPWQTLTPYTFGLSETNPTEADPQLGRGLYNGRDPNAPAPGLPTAGGDIEVPLCLAELGWWLRGLLGAPVTTGAGADKAHTFESGKDALPFATLQMRLASNDFRRFRGVAINALAISADKVSNFPRFRFSTLARDQANETASLSGTINAGYTQVKPPAARAVARWEGVVIGEASNVTLNYANNFTPNMFLDGSVYPTGMDPQDVTLNGSMTMRYQGPTWENIARARTPGRLEIEWAMPGALAATRKVTFDMGRVLIEAQGLPVTGPGVMTQSLTWGAEQTGADPALKVVLANAIASY